MKRVMLRLVRTGEDVRDTRQRQARSNLLAMGKDNLGKAAIDVVINSLVDGRLLVSDRIKNEDVIDLSHEALIQSWQRFAKWRGENRDVRRLAQRVQAAHKKWSDKGKDDEYLMQGGFLLDVDPYWGALSDILDSAVQNFYERSKSHRDSQSLRLQYPAIKEQLEKQAKKTSYIIETAPHQAALETIQSIGVSLVKLEGAIIPSIQSNLRALADTFSQPESYPLEKQASSYTLSPDGQKVAVGYGDGSIQLLNTRGKPLGKPFPAHEESIYSRKLIFTPDCDTILSSDGREIKFWSLSGDLVGVILDVYECHGSYLNRMVCSPDGKWLVSNDDDGTVCLWGLHDRLLRWSAKTEHYSFCVAFSPDSQKIISSGSDPNIQMRNLAGNLSHKGFEEDGYMVIHSIEFSPDGQKIVGGGNDGGIVIWDLSGRRIARAQAHHFVEEPEETTSWAKISPNGNIVASFSEDSKLRLWDMDANPIGRPLKFNSGRMGISDEFVFTPDGQQIMMLNDKGITFFLGGTWKDWLEICCNYLRYHPSMNDPDNPVAVEACEVCRKYVWEKENSQPPISS